MSSAPMSTRNPIPAIEASLTGETKQRLREHLVLCLAFGASRDLLWFLGVRLNFILDWMWLADPADLQHDFLHTLFYFHAYPPGMNLLTGILLKVGGSHAALLGLVTFATFTLLLINALFYLLRRTGLSFPTALSIALAFSLTPPTIYFEHLYMYEAPIASLLCLSALCFYEAIRRPSFWMFFAFFLISAAIGTIRSTFHLVWFVFLVALSLWFARSHWRTVLRGAAIPAALLSSLYVKNLLVFGLFDVFTFGPVSLDLVTIRQLPPALRDTWIAERKLSPYAAIDVFAGPREYLPYFARSDNPAFPPELSLLERPSVRAPNYNHWLFLEVMQKRRSDAFAYLRSLPGPYAHTVWRGMQDFFSPSTKWHPFDERGGSPHEQVRQVLGAYERFYNRLLHGFPGAPVGFYILVPLVLLWAIGRAFPRRVSTAPPALTALLVFCVLQIGYVFLASCLFTFQESARYRYQIEAFIWLLAALALADALRRLAALGMSYRAGHRSGASG
jgi:4-amino-4-deoxy-L-arabinose transferase-like glycosyltransferase